MTKKPYTLSKVRNILRKGSFNFQEKTLHSTATARGTLSMRENEPNVAHKIRNEKHFLYTGETKFPRDIQKSCVYYDQFPTLITSAAVMSAVALTGKQDSTFKEKICVMISDPLLSRQLRSYWLLHSLEGVKKLVRTLHIVSQNSTEMYIL